MSDQVIVVTEQSEIAVVESDGVTEIVQIADETIAVVEIAQQGPPGARGDKGDRGDAGAAATIQVGTVTTGAPGSSASVTNAGTASAAVLNFTIPRGAAGLDGDDGDDGRAVELQTTATHIQWRYLGDVSWTNLVALADLKGDRGDVGPALDPWRGTWDSNETYVAGDIVQYNGASYLAVADNGPAQAEPVSIASVTQTSNFGGPGVQPASVELLTDGLSEPFVGTTGGAEQEVRLNLTSPQFISSVVIGATTTTGGWGALYLNGAQLEASFNNGANWQLIEALGGFTNGSFQTIAVGLANVTNLRVRRVGSGFVAISEFDPSGASGFPDQSSDWTLFAAAGTDGTDGDDGSDGADGADGADGREIELQKTLTHIQWRYVGETWTNLVALSEIQGAKGDKGDQGDAGADGADGADGVGVPAGGTTGQALIKSSNADYATEWGDVAQSRNFNGGRPVDLLASLQVSVFDGGSPADLV